MVTYMAVGSGKFVSTFLGLPDVGKITDQLNDEEIKEIESILNKLRKQKEDFLQ